MNNIFVSAEMSYDGRRTKFESCFLKENHGSKQYFSCVHYNGSPGNQMTKCHL